MNTLDDIRNSLSARKEHLFKKYPIKTLAIFGSYARNEQNENSDLDIMVEFHDTIGIEFIDLAEELEKAVGLKVDLVSRKGIKDKYFAEISNELIVV